MPVTYGLRQQQVAGNRWCHRGTNVSSAATRVIVGRRTKWLVLLFWIVLVAVAGPLAGKLTGAEQNDAKCWLPGKAESTQVLDLQAAFQSPNTIPAVIVYERTAGLTAADKAVIAADVQQFPSLGKIDGHITGPLYSSDGKARRSSYRSTSARTDGTARPTSPSTSARSARTTAA